MSWNGHAFDRWLTNQPWDDVLLIEQPDHGYDPDQFNFDEWFCRDCQTHLGFHLCGDDSGAWRDHYLLPDEETRLCEPCFELVTAEPDYESEV